MSLRTICHGFSTIVPVVVTVVGTTGVVPVAVVVDEAVVVHGVLDALVHGVVALGTVEELICPMLLAVVVATVGGVEVEVVALPAGGWSDDTRRFVGEVLPGVGVTGGSVVPVCIGIGGKGAEALDCVPEVGCCEEVDGLRLLSRLCIIIICII